MDTEPKQPKAPNRPPLTLAAIHVARSLSQEIRTAPDAVAGEVLADHVKALNMLAELRQKYSAGESLEDAET